MRHQEASDQSSAAGRHTASAGQTSAPPPCVKKKGEEDEGAVKEAVQDHLSYSQERKNVFS